MKSSKANLLNSIVLILLGLWGYFDTNAITALIPVIFGVVLFLCNNGVKKENKVVAHVAVFLTLLILIALVGMRLPKSLENPGVGLYRVLAMITTSALAMISFIQSFIKNRQNL